MYNPTEHHRDNRMNDQHNNNGVSPESDNMTTEVIIAVPSLPWNGKDSPLNAVYPSDQVNGKSVIKQQLEPIQHPSLLLARDTRSTTSPAVLVPQHNGHHGHSHHHSHKNDGSKKGIMSKLSSICGCCATFSYFINCCGMGRSVRLSAMLALTLSFFFVEIIVGYMTSSMALVADSFHMLSDVLALMIAFACMKVAKRRTKSNTFGWVRAEVLGALVNAVFLLALCFSIFVEAIKRLVEPERIKDPQLILVVGAIGLFINIIGIFMFHGHGGGHGHSHGGGGGHGHSHGPEVSSDEELVAPAVVKEAHCITMSRDDSDDRLYTVSTNLNNTLHDDTMHQKEQLLLNNNSPVPSNDAGGKQKGAKAKKSSAQLNMRGVFLHVLGDALGSIIVVVNAILCMLIPEEKFDGFFQKYLDPALSLVMVTIICSTTIPLLKETALILLQTPPKDIDVHELKDALLKLPGVQAVHEFHVWRLAGMKVIATSHIKFHELADWIASAEKIKQLFHDFDIHSTTIQPEFETMRSRMQSEHASAATLDRVSTDPHIAGIGGRRDSMSQCFVKCPPAECDVSATCCGPVKSLKEKPTTARAADDDNLMMMQRANTADKTRLQLMQHSISFVVSYETYSGIRACRKLVQKYHGPHPHQSKSAEDLDVYRTPPETRTTTATASASRTSAVGRAHLAAEPDTQTETQSTHSQNIERRI